MNGLNAIDLLPLFAVFILYSLALAAVGWQGGKKSAYRKQQKSLLLGGIYNANRRRK